MALSEIHRRTVMLISGSLDAAANSEAALRGTGFAVGVPTVDPNQVWPYVVTAAHVVRPCRTTFIRMTQTGGSTVDLEIPKSRWVFHPREDVAVAPFEADPDEVRLSVVATPDFVGSTKTQFAVAPGDEVLFAGLLGLVPSMGARNIPMVRSGAVGALHQDGIPMRLQDDTLVSVHGHLIDCRSFGGFSGSPCFVRFTSGINITPRLGLKTPINSTLLLGLVGGHFDLHASVTLPEQEDGIDVPVAAGIAVVLPSETIMEVLQDEDLLSDRARRDAEVLLEQGEDQ